MTPCDTIVRTARFQNWLPYLRTEVYRGIYDQAIWPKNLPPMDDAGAGKVLDETISRLTSRGSFTKRSS